MTLLMIAGLVVVAIIIVMLFRDIKKRTGL